MGKLFDSLSWCIYSIQRASLFLLLKIKCGKTILENSLAISYHLKHMLIIGPSNSTTMYLVNKVAIITPIL